MLENISTADESSLVEVEGQIESITYSNEENGFTIAKLKVKGNRAPITVVGTLVTPAPGETLKIKGSWVKHPKYGEQLQVDHYTIEVPASIHGIEKYLSSGIIKGIGPAMAKRITEKFGKETIHILDHQIERLGEIEGIGEKRIAMVGKAWQEQHQVRSVMMFLQSYGVGSGYAAKIFQKYGNHTIDLLKENPFRLATDIVGIGFITADKVANKLGFPKECQIRAEAGILYVLNHLADEGHVCYPYEALVGKCIEMLGIGREVITQAFEVIALEQKIVVEESNENRGEDNSHLQPNSHAVFLKRFHVCETGIAAKLKALVSAPKSVKIADTEKALHWAQQSLAIRLADQQRQALEIAMQSKVMVITGGPGTGKTTIINAILRVFSHEKAKIVLAAPTGRAAKRMHETTGHEAKTIHRLLEYSVQGKGFQKTADNPVECDIIIIDEASMIDTVLMHHLLKAIPLDATLILVGDVNQLPSVGPGNVLSDIIGSAAVPVVELDEIFRQAKQSLIIVNAHKIQEGELPITPPPGSSLSDFYFISQQDPNAALTTIIELVKERIPKRFELNSVDGIQVLTPMHRGTLGAANLNAELQKCLNPSQEGINKGGVYFKLNDKVMQLKNNYDKEVFNGDIGRIVRIDSENQELSISFDGRTIDFDFSDLDDIVLAYAVSVHKSQGSEYPAVVIPITTQHYVLLQRNLLYTAVTRARKLVVLVGTKRALAIAVNNDNQQRRYSRLRDRLAKPAAAS